MPKKKQNKAAHSADECPNCAAMKRAMVAQAKAFAPRGAKGNAIDEKEAAVFLGYSVKKMQKMRQDGTGPAYIKDGRLIRYLPVDLRKYQRQHRVTSNSQADVRKSRRQKK